MTTVPALLLSERRRRQNAECDGYAGEAGTPGIGASRCGAPDNAGGDGPGTGFEKGSLRALIDRGMPRDSRRSMPKILISFELILL